MQEREETSCGARLARVISVLVILGTLGALAVTPGRAEPREFAPAFLGLLGEWEGSGELMGRPARFWMRWCPVLDGAFVRLEFHNAFEPEDGAGASIPVLRATAYYRSEADDAGILAGTWVDTRGLILPLAGGSSETTLVTRWGDASTERGRTTYRVQISDTVEVVDEVLQEGEYATFGRATYVRRQDGHAACSGSEAAAPGGP